MPLSLSLISAFPVQLAGGVLLCVRPAHVSRDSGGDRNGRVHQASRHPACTQHEETGGVALKGGGGGIPRRLFTVVVEAIRFLSPI